MFACTYFLLFFFIFSGSTGKSHSGGKSSAFHSVYLRVDIVWCHVLTAGRGYSLLTDRQHYHSSPYFSYYNCRVVRPFMHSASNVRTRKRVATFYIRYPPLPPSPTAYSRSFLQYRRTYIVKKKKKKKTWSFSNAPVVSSRTKTLINTTVVGYWVHGNERDKKKNHVALSRRRGRTLLICGQCTRARIREEIHAVRTLAEFVRTRVCNGCMKIVSEIIYNRKKW